MKAIAVAAGAIHGLSLSIAHGGPVFAKVGLKRALRNIASEEERRAVMQRAWSHFSKVNVPAHVGFTASWLVLRSMIKHAHLDRSTKHLVVAKDVLIAGALITGVAATINGKAMKRALAAISTTKPSEASKPISKEDKNTAKEDKNAAQTAKSPAEKEYQRLCRTEKKLGRANMALTLGAILISPAIAVGVLRSRRMGILARLFNR